MGEGSPRDGASRSRPSTPRASTGGASLSARYLSQPQRLVGCSLPPLARDAGATTRTRGFVTLAVPHILESAATTQSLPETTLVRFRWRHEASARGSLFQPAKTTNAPGLLLQRRTTRKQREVAGGEHDADDSGEEEESKQQSNHSHASTRSIEMVYPICVDAQHFVEYLRDMNELVLDVIDRNTRRKYGKCVIPLFNDTPAALSGDSHTSQESVPEIERVLRQLRRENALYEIKSLDAGQDDDMIALDDFLENGSLGYLAVKLDVQFRDLDDGDLVDPAPASLLPRSLDTVSPPAAVLIPHTRPAAHVNVRQPLKRRQHENSELHYGLQFGPMSPISYLESDALHSLEGSSPRSEGVLASLCSLPRRGEKRAHEVTSLPMHSSKLHHLIEKGKALQKSMAKAAEDGDDDWYDPRFPVTSASTRNTGAQEIENAALHEDLSGSVSDHDPQSWQSILKQTQIPSTEIEQEVAYGSLIGSGKPIHSHSIKAARGLKIRFEALKFSSDFIDQLQQMRDSAISSRFSPIKMAVSHSDIATLLATTTDSSVDQVECTESLFTIAPSLRKRAFRLTYSHVVPLQSRGNSSTLGLVSHFGKKQLQFFITCKTQGTPRRLQQSSRNGKKHRIVLRGAVPVLDILFDQGPTPEPKVANVSLFILEEIGSSAARLRSRENAHRVGVLKVRFHQCNVEADNSGPEIKGESHLILSSPPSSRESVAQSFEAPNSLLDTRRKKPRERSNPTLNKTRKRPVPTLKIATQLAVMIDKVSSVCSSEARLSKFALEGSFIRFQYAIPQSSSARESSQLVSSFKRSFKRKLIRVAGSQNSSSKCYANVGHIGVFSLELDQLLARDFTKKLLIIEVWLQGVHHAKDDEGELLGLVKIPFSAFSSCFRESSSDWDQAIPFVGIDDRLPIEDPFSGHVSGFLQLRIAVGTAEQIIALTSTVRAIVQLQAIVRGVLCRRKSLIYREAKRYSTTERDSSRTSTSNGYPGKVEDVYRGRTIAVMATEDIPRKESWGQLQNPDNDQPERNVILHVDDDIQVHDSTKSRNDYVHEIRLEIRECWRSARQGHSEQRGAWKEPSSVIGCEVQGELLVVHDQMAIPNEAKSVQFALWWDASHSQLNSHFEHSLRSKDSRGEYGLLANEVKFTFHAQTDFAQSSSSNGRQGQAVLNLQKILKDAINPESLRINQHIRLEKDIDVPIEWEDGSSSCLSRIFPVRVCYRVSSRTPAILDEFQPILPARSPRMPNEEQTHSSLMTTISISATRRLLPATITLSIHVLSVADLKHAIEERWSQVCASSSEKGLKKHLEELLTDGAASVIFECDACLGVEIEEAVEERIVEQNGTTSHLYKKNERWYKKFQFPTARCDVANTQQLLSNTLSPFQLKIVVHPEAMQIMQNECLEFRILSWCPRSNAEYQIGTVSVPIAAVLFRPSGVQGAFPISICDVLSGRLGVHVRIDHQPDVTISDPKVPAMGFEEQEIVAEAAGSIVHRPVSPTSPDEVATDQNSSNLGEGNQPIQVAVEDFRNLQNQDGGVDERDVLFSSEIEYFDGEDWLRDDTFANVDGGAGHFHRVGDIETRSLSSSCVGRTPTLRIGVWHDDCTNAEDSVGTERLARSPMLIGWCVVDLSLLQAGWREVHGWYHIFDGQQISRGQVKIKASLGSGEQTTVETQENSLSATQHLERRERELAEGLSGDGDQELFQLGFGMFSDTLRSKDADESRMSFSLSAENVASSVILMSEMSTNRLEAIKPSNHPEEYDEDSKCFSAAPNTVTLEQINEQTGDCEGEMIAERDGAPADVDGRYDHAVTEADDAADRSPTDRYFNLEKDPSAVSDEGEGQTDEASSYYKPITLSSFGIEEIQLSPLSDRLPPSTSSTDQDPLAPAGEKYDEQVTLNELDSRDTAEPESSATLQFPLCTPGELEEAFVDDVPPLSATSPCEESDVKQDITEMKSGHATAEDVAYKSGSDRASESSTCHSPAQLDTARRGSFFAVEEHHDAPNDSRTTSVLLNEETRSLDSGDGDQDSGIPVCDRSDMSSEPVTILHVTSNLGDADDTPTVPSKRDTLEDEETLSTSEPKGGFVDVAVETYEVVKDEKSTQADMESCILEEDVLAESNGAEGDGGHWIQTKSEVIENGERGDSVGQDVPQPELLHDRTTKKEMVGVGCGAADDFDDVADQISTRESKTVMRHGGEPTEDHLESNEENAERSYPQDGETVEVDGKNADAPPSGDLNGSISFEMELLHQPQESTKLSSLSLPSDKFELICQLLTEIRDSCGSGLVREILQAHNAQVALNESRTELITTEERISTSQEGKVTAKQNEAEVKADQISMDESVLTKSRGEELMSPSHKLRQPRGPVLTENTKRDGIVERDYKGRLSYSGDAARENPGSSPTHFSRRDLKAAYWSDSSTLQQEMQRRLAASDAGQDSRSAVDYNNIGEVDGKSHTGPCRDSKLFGDEYEAQVPSLFAYQSRQMKKSLSYKADSETERIARIMQGSVNYWRKGDEHALTSDDDSVDSFDSDDDEDCYF